MSGFVPHAIERFFERTDLEITRNQIIRAIEGGNIVYAKRLTASKSLAYVLVGENVVKIIIAKGTKKVMSILPWKSIFKKMISIDSEHYNGLFEICLFPDCYLETKCSHSLTKINNYILIKQKNLYLLIIHFFTVYLKLPGKILFLQKDTKKYKRKDNQEMKRLKL